MNYSYHNMCLNLSSVCNLECSWCYKQSDKSFFLSLSDFKDFYINIIDNNIDKIVLIGGEPTIHPDFISLLNILANKQIYLTSNGLLFSDKRFLNDCIKTQKLIRGQLSGIQSISISLKGYDKISFLSTTKVDKFEYLCQAIDNLNNCNIPVTYNYVFSTNISSDERGKFLSFLKKFEISKIIISDARPYISEGKVIHTNIIDNLDELFYYLDSNGVTSYFRTNHPLCEYNSKFIEYLLNNNKIISNCALKRCNGYFFSSSLELIPCNELYKVNLGRYKLDFNNFEELNQLWHSQSITNFYQKLSGYPQLNCIKCNMWNICGGNCILHWIKEA